MTGRPTKYQESYNIQAFKLCLLGATDKEIADFFEVNEDTVHEWKKVYPNFSESIKAGKDEADANVGHSLYQRALGYSHPEVDIRVIGSEIVQTDIVKHYPPDPTSMIFWLKNRQKTKWRDKTETDITSGGEAIGTPDPAVAAKFAEFLAKQ